jgi:hypothetical protein
LTVVGLRAGPQVRIDLANANHLVIDSQTVSFVVPKDETSSHGHH